jgi:hypothetical protein
MTPFTDTNMVQESRYETPTFDPRGAFAWTLRGGEMARSEHPARLKVVAASSEPGGTGSNRATKTNGTERHCETPTFDPRGAFARTLRGGEMARRERQRQQAARPLPAQIQDAISVQHLQWPENPELHPPPESCLPAVSGL